MTKWLVLLCRQSSGRVGSSKVGRGLATKLHPHLIGLARYIAMEVKQKKNRRE